jgi:peptidyl-prolyl isomerase E (cyclophilin E)
MSASAYRRTLYVGNIDETANEEIVRAAFIPFGEIVSIDLPIDPRSRTLMIVLLHFE